MRVSRRLGLAIASLLCATTARAQNSAAADTLRPVRTSSGDSSVAPRQLEAVRVTGKAVPRDPTGFDERLAHRGFGYFVTAKSIEPMHASSMSRIFAIVPGLRVMPTKYGNQLISRGINAQLENCAPAVFLDGSLVFDGAAILETVIRPDHLRGMEVYLQQGSAPPPYDRDPCGTVLVWTKAGGPREPRTAPSDSTP